jgi:3',5'-cyclic AMP phosphodiesterase CpdA
MTSSRPRAAIVANILLIALASVATGCELLKYSPHQDDLASEASQVNKKNIARISTTPPGDTVRFAFVSDTQNHYDDSQRFVRDVNSRDDIDFVVHGGDITHFGVIQEYEWMHDIFSELAVPYLAVIGNHDILANGGDLYDAVYGKRNFSFVYARTKYVFVDTNSRQYGFPGDVPDLEWLRDRIAPADDFDRAIVIAHAPPNHAEFDKELAEPFGTALEASTTVELALFGHEHKYSVKKPYGDVTYLVTPSVEKHQYIMVSVSEDGVSFETVDF